MPAGRTAPPGPERGLFGQFTDGAAGSRQIADRAGASGLAEILRNPVPPGGRPAKSTRDSPGAAARGISRLDTCSPERPRLERRSPSAERTRRMLKRLVIAVAVALSPALLLSRRRSATTTRRPPTSPRFKTYAFKDGTKVGQPLIDDRIVAAIEQELAAKGFTKADANPDVFVVYHIDLRQAEGHLNVQLRLRRRLRRRTGGAGAAAGPAARRRRRCATS